MKVIIYRKTCNDCTDLGIIGVKRYNKKNMKEFIGKDWDVDHRIVNI
jgi:hypothetical protein